MKMMAYTPRLSEISSADLDNCCSVRWAGFGDLGNEKMNNVSTRKIKENVYMNKRDRKEGWYVIKYGVMWTTARNDLTGGCDEDVCRDFDITVRMGW